jgi:hypothetical protein
LLLIELLVEAVVWLNSAPSVVMSDDVNDDEGMMDIMYCIY